MAFYIVLLLVGSVTVSKKVNELTMSVKRGDTEKIRIDVFFLLLTFIITILIAIKELLLLSL